MIGVPKKVMTDKIELNHLIAKVEGAENGPTIVFFGGIHGNETAGVLAIKEALFNIKPKKVKGTIYGLAGNLKALELQKRYITTDLNRLWTKSNIAKIKTKNTLNSEERELVVLLNLIQDILKTNTPPFYFIDLHTTSSKTLPFITINDALINRKFSKQFPVPIVLGIEEYLNGALLSYINGMGYVSLGFESGQHDDIQAITNSVAFIHLALSYSGVLKNEMLFDYDSYYNTLQIQAAHVDDTFEITYLHKIKTNDCFKMHEGFKSFEPIKKGTAVATSNGKPIKTKYNGVMFMPLYQNQGAEGFFIIKPIHWVFLKLSAVLRDLRFDTVLVLLPGITWYNKQEGVLQVNLKIARFFAKSVFHLLGYRSKHITVTHLQINSRERVAKTLMYKNEAWYK